ncbi:unnamed protein product [Ilex paraguariensis]|uniref:COX assembly mitochondrial protein n=1 Tax=Ilex paraguariensis TaxID=185542 RepID=A0ABC8U0L8_9AQUA
MGRGGYYRRRAERRGPFWSPDPDETRERLIKAAAAEGFTSMAEYSMHLLLPNISTRCKYLSKILEECMSKYGNESHECEMRREYFDSMCGDVKKGA